MIQERCTNYSNVETIGNNYARRMTFGSCKSNQYCERYMLKTDVKKLKMLTVSTSEAKILTFDPGEIQTGFHEQKFIWIISNWLTFSFCESDENSWFYMLSNFWHDQFWEYVNNIFIRKVKQVYNIGLKFPHYYLNYCVKSL